MMRNNEQGRSMIEMLGVLAIVGVLSVGGIAGYSKAMNKFKTNKAIDQVQMISTNIRTLFSSQRNYNGLDNVVAARTNSIPSEMYSASALTDNATELDVRNAFGGEVDIHAATQNADDDSYVIFFEGIPAGSCQSFVTTDWGGDAGSGLVAMAAGSDVEKTTLDTKTENSSNDVHIPGDKDYGIPYTLTQALEACGTTGSVNFLWKYL